MKYNISKKDDLQNQLWPRLGIPLYNKLRNRLRNRLRDRLRDRLFDQLDIRLWRLKVRLYNRLKNYELL